VDRVGLKGYVYIQNPGAVPGGIDPNRYAVEILRLGANKTALATHHLRNSFSSTETIVTCVLRS